MSVQIHGVPEQSGQHQMLIQVTTDSKSEGHEVFSQGVEDETRRHLNRFAHQIMSVNVHFTDANGAKHGSSDKHCVMEARTSGRPPVAVTGESDTIESAFHGAVKKLQRLLESSLGKAEAHKARETIRAKSSDAIE